MPTYTYKNLNGEGEWNHFHNHPHQNLHVRWHFVYFGYSFNEKKAYSYVQFFNQKSLSHTYNNVNHYLPPTLWVYIGKDINKGNNFYSGKIGYVNVNLGEGAFRAGKDFNHPDDIFSVKVYIGDDDSDKDDTTVEIDDVQPSSHDQEKPVFEEKND